MQINSISNYYNKSCSMPNFKQGLTRDIVNHVKNMPSDEYKRITERLQNKYGLHAEVGGSNTVAFCVEQTANIINKAGFAITKLFSFKPLNGRHFGEYFYNDEIAINSRYSEFLDLEQLNKLEEENNKCNGSKHFLNSYLHEFLHAGHYINIIEKKGTDKGRDIFWNKFDYERPYYSLQLPLLKFMDCFFPKLTYDERINLLPETPTIYQSDNVAEYFAERNSLKLENQLGDDFNIDNIEENMAQNYKGFPENWSIDDEVKKIINSVKPDERVQNTLNDILNCFEGEIWNGNVERIIEKGHTFENYGKTRKYTVLNI